MRTGTGSSCTNPLQPLPLLEVPDGSQHTADVQLCCPGHWAPHCWWWVIPEESPVPQPCEDTHLHLGHGSSHKTCSSLFGRSCFCSETWDSHFLYLFFPLGFLVPNLHGQCGPKGSDPLGLLWEGWKQDRLFKYQLFPHGGADNHISSTVLAAIMGK